jgi:hypothetical protein
MANISFTFEGVDGTITDTYEMSDEDAARMLEAYTQLFTPPPLHHGRPSGPPTPPEPLTTEDVIHKIAAGFWNELSQTTETYDKQKAANEAASGVTPVTPVEVRMGGTQGRSK